MRLGCTARLWSSWIAVLAVLMAALAPSVSHALNAKSGSPWVEICSAVGAKWVQPDDAPADEIPVPAGMHALEHCPYCTPHADALAIPAAPSAALASATPGDESPLALPAAPSPPRAWLNAPPRAPPTLS